MWAEFMHNLKKAIVFTIVLIALAGTSGMHAQAEERLRIVATTGMIADAAREIGGELVEVKALMGPGVDPHAYRQTRTDIIALAKADLILWHGLYLEAQMEDLMKRMAGRKPVIAVAEKLPERLLIAHEDYEGRFDPHVWMNPDIWNRVVVEVRNALIATQPAHEEAFRLGADKYADRIAQLSSYAKKSLATVPPQARVLLTAHDAFNYFGEAYGFEVIGIQGISTASEAGLKRIAQLADMLVERKISAVFVESSVSDRNVRALIEGAAAQGHEVVVGGELFSDAMGEYGAYEGTYIGMIDHNVTTIVRALGGQAPEKGMLQRLF